MISQNQRESYVDANLHHYQVTGRAITACLHIVNATPSHWHTKRHSTVQTATFGSEFVAARIATDQIIESGTLSCILESQSDPKATCQNQNMFTFCFEGIDWRVPFPVLVTWI